MSKEKAELEVFELLTLGAIAKLPEESRHEIDVLIENLKTEIAGADNYIKVGAASMLYIEVMKENV